jgi:hypothetical protein
MRGKWRAGRRGVRNLRSFIEIRKGVGEEGKQGARVICLARGGQREAAGEVVCCWWWWMRAGDGFYRWGRGQAPGGGRGTPFFIRASRVTGCGRSYYRGAVWDPACLAPLICGAWLSVGSRCPTVSLMGRRCIWLCEDFSSNIVRKKTGFFLW